MAVKIADTLKAMSNTFPVAECVDIDVNINGTTKRLQKAIDDGEIGGGSDSTWKGTHEEWEALSTEEKGKYEVICFTDDYDESGICGSDSTWKGTHEEWEALSTEEKGKYEVVYFTDDYDGSGICESDSTWKGTRDEWEALSPTDKEKYVIVYFTDDYDGADSTGLIDDTNTSVKTTYSSSKIENSLAKKANSTDLTSHTSDTSIHVTTSDKTKWNKIDNKIDKTNIVDNLTSTDTDKPLSANQGKILKDKIGLKANTTDLTSHTSDTNTHITTNERTKWNEVDNKVNKTDIVDNLTSTDTNKPLSAKQGKALNDKIGLKANETEVVKKTDITTTINSTSTDNTVPTAKSVYNLAGNENRRGYVYNNPTYRGDTWNRVFRVNSLLSCDSGFLTVTVYSNGLCQIATFLMSKNFNRLNIKQINCGGYNGNNGKGRPIKVRIVSAETIGYSFLEIYVSGTSNTNVIATYMPLSCNSVVVLNEEGSIPNGLFACEMTATHDTYENATYTSVLK